MSEADKLFEKMGYEKIINERYKCEYIKYFRLKNPRHILFGIDKTVSVCEENDKYLLVNKDYFTMEELQAINKKCEELGWK